MSPRNKRSSPNKRPHFMTPTLASFHARSSIAANVPPKAISPSDVKTVTEDKVSQAIPTTINRKAVRPSDSHGSSYGSSPVMFPDKLVSTSDTHSGPGISCVQTMSAVSAITEKPLPATPKESEGSTKRDETKNTLRANSNYTIQQHGTSRRATTSLGGLLQHTGKQLMEHVALPTPKQTKYLASVNIHHSSAIPISTFSSKPYNTPARQTPPQSFRSFSLPSKITRPEYLALDQLDGKGQCCEPLPGPQPQRSAGATTLQDLIIAHPEGPRQICGVECSTDDESPGMRKVVDFSDATGGAMPNEQVMYDRHNIAEQVTSKKDHRILTLSQVVAVDESAVELSQPAMASRADMEHRDQMEMGDTTNDQASTLSEQISEPSPANNARLDQTSAGTTADAQESETIMQVAKQDTPCDHLNQQERATCTTSKMSDHGTSKSNDQRSKMTKSQPVIETAQSFRVRRLSNKAPEHGPTLKICSSADKFIMGTGQDKENENIHTDDASVKDDRYPPSTRRPINGKISLATQKRLARSFSASNSGHPSLVSSQKEFIDRGHKMRSMAHEFEPKDHLGIPNDSTTSKHASLGTQASSTTNDPFYDAPETNSAEGMTSPKVLDDKFRPRDPYRSSESLLINKDEKAAKQAKSEHRNARILGPKATKPTVISYKAGARLHLNGTAGSDCAEHALVDTAEPSKRQSSLSQDFVRRQNNLGSARGHASSQLDLSTPAPTKDRAHMRYSLRSQASAPTLASKSRFTIRGLFHKRSTPSVQEASNKPHTERASIHGAFRFRAQPKYRLSRPGDLSSAASPPSFPSSANNRSSIQSFTPPSSAKVMVSLGTKTTTPSKEVISDMTSLAMDLLDSARKESNSPKKERLLHLGRVVVDIITQTREAEKAAEEARMAVLRAEKAKEACLWAVGECGRMIEHLRATP